MHKKVQRWSENSTAFLHTSLYLGHSVPTLGAGNLPPPPLNPSRINLCSMQTWVWVSVYLGGRNKSGLEPGENARRIWWLQNNRNLVNLCPYFNNERITSSHCITLGFVTRIVVSSGNTLIPVYNSSGLFTACVNFKTYEEYCCSHSRGSYSLPVGRDKAPAKYITAHIISPDPKCQQPPVEK